MARLLIEQPDHPIGYVDLVEGAELSVGRGASAEVRFDDRRVSRAHATLTFDGSTVVVRDGPSRYGTFLGIERVRGACPVSDGAVMGFGSFDCVLRLKLPEAPRPAVSDEEVVACDPLTVELFALVRRLAAIDIAVVVEGPAGVGKEVVARALHRHSARAQRPFIAVDCAALTGAFATTVLFGQAGGPGRGVFEEADGGTVMLGDVDELSAPNQELLLRLLRDRRLARPGSRSSTPVDVRVVASTRRDLALAVARGRFRQDLHALLRRAALLVPALRSRPGDVAPLAARILRERGGSCRLGPEALAALQGHAWSGNVRELLRVMEGAIASAAGGVIGPEHLWLRPRRVPSAPPIDRRPSSSPPSRLTTTERRVIVAALEATGGNRSAAARELGISRRCLLARIERHALGAASATDDEG